jgi:hypothetical protein
MDDQAAVIAGIVNGVNQVFNAIIRQLDAKGVMSKTQFVDAMESGVKSADAERPPGVPRVDLELMRNLAKLLRDPKATGWTPTVIKGGLSDDKDGENSH